MVRFVAWPKAWERGSRRVEVQSVCLSFRRMAEAEEFSIDVIDAPEGVHWDQENVGLFHAAAARAPVRPGYDDSRHCM